MDANGRVLIARRPPGKVLAGAWEFPGGKAQAGETRPQALARELKEELGITLIERPRPLIRVHHRYPFGAVLIDLWVVRRYGGELRGVEGQTLRWCPVDQLEDEDLLPADQPIIHALRLPERLSAAPSLHYTVGAAGAKRHGRLRGVLCMSAAEGLILARGRAADFLVLASVIPESELAMLCQAVDVPVYVVGASLEQAWALGATGLNDIWSAGR